MRKHLGVWGEKPQRVQGSALPPAAQARGAGQRPAARRAGAGCRGGAPLAQERARHELSLPGRRSGRC
ncbi:hypothetical protein D3Z52_15555 [Clostridiaceae bacterium]|nr:hypothetical protein [Clostridiaceae bacterium]